MKRRVINERTTELPRCEMGHGGTGGSHMKRAIVILNGKGLQGREQHGSPDQGREAKPYGSACECGSDVSNTDRQMRKCRIKFGDPARECGFANDGWWPAEPNVGRVANGVPYRVDRLKCLGNAVVPQQFYPIFRAIAYLEVTQWENTQSAECGL